MKKYYFLLLLLCIFSLSALYSYTIYRDLSDNLLRLHIVANSNSEYDQNIKLLVRDEIIKGTKSIPHPDRINEIADDALAKTCAGYGVRTEISESYVPEKEYKNIRLPEGKYTCLKVVLGEGMGENWWCIAYPPLCFCEEVFGEMTESSMELLENRLSPESFRAIVKDGNINFRFRIVEEFQKFKVYIKKM